MKNNIVLWLLSILDKEKFESVMDKRTREIEIDLKDTPKVRLEDHYIVTRISEGHNCQRVTITKTSNSEIINMRRVKNIIRFIVSRLGQEDWDKEKTKDVRKILSNLL